MQRSSPAPIEKVQAKIYSILHQTPQISTHLEIAALEIPPPIAVCASWFSNPTMQSHFEVKIAFTLLKCKSNLAVVLTKAVRITLLHAVISEM